MYCIEQKPVSRSGDQPIQSDHVAVV